MIALLKLLLVLVVPAALWYAVAIPIWRGNWPKSENARLGLGIALGWLALLPVLVWAEGALWIVVILNLGFAAGAAASYKAVVPESGDRWVTVFYVALLGFFFIGMIVAKS